MLGQEGAESMSQQSRRSTSEEIEAVSSLMMDRALDAVVRGVPRRVYQ
jgi:hypothetical protein